MNVLCWHQPVVALSGREPDWQELLGLWTKSWQDKGFQPRVIGMPIARLHPLFRPAYSKARSLPTCNPVEYEAGCWIRWLAAAKVAHATQKPLLMSDSDVMNFGLKPSEFNGCKDDIVILDRDRVCCLVYLTPRGAERVVEAFMAYRPSDGCSQVSDMLFWFETFSRKLPVPSGVGLRTNICMDYDYVKKSPQNRPPCVHFSAKSCTGGRTPKSDAVKHYGAR